MQVLLQVATIFLLMVMGYVAIYFKVIDKKSVTAISAVVLYFAQPCLILGKMQQEASPQLLRELMLTFVLCCVIMSVSGIIAWNIFRKEPHDRRAVLANLVMASNCGFMGYPVIIAAMGEEALIYAVMYVAGFNCVCWTLGAWFFRGKEAASPLKIIANPTMVALAAGLVLLLMQWHLPKFVNDALDSMGSTTTPLAMFIIGTRLVGIGCKDISDWKMLFACALRLLAVPLCALFILRLTPIPETVANALFFCSAMPGASLTAMQADVFNCEKEFASRAVAVSTAFSMATVPLLLLLTA